MFHYWKKVDELHHINRLLLSFIAILLLIVGGLIIALTQLPNRFEFWLSPSMQSNGGLVKESQIPKEYIQGFVATLVPTLNTWSKEGKKEFAHNLASFHYYFTPRHQELMEQSQKTYKEAQFFQRTQVASLYRFMEESDVTPLSATTWEVHLVLRITQRLKNNNAMVIADKVVEYTIRVAKVSTSRLHNPFQLALDGYTKPERLIKDLLATPVEEQHHETL